MDPGDVIRARSCQSLREENGRLERIAADLKLDRHIQEEIVSKKL